MVMSSKWMRLIGLVGFTAVLVSCKQTPQAPMNANYATMKGNYIPVYTSLSIIITNSHKLIGIEFVRNKERR